jgi:hypothetical protein
MKLKWKRWSTWSRLYQRSRDGEAAHWEAMATWLDARRRHEARDDHQSAE